MSQKYPRVAPGVTIIMDEASNGVSSRLTADPLLTLPADTGVSGYSGVSGFSGYQGISGYSGYSGYSGTNGIIGLDGVSGYSGLQGIQGVSGYSGIDGLVGTSGYSGYSGYSGLDGAAGTSGYSGISGAVGTSGYSGISGTGGLIEGVVGPTVVGDVTPITLSPDLSTGTVFIYELWGSIIINDLTNAASGSSATIILIQGGEGGNTLTSTIPFASGIKTLSTAIGAVDMISILYAGTTYYASLTTGYV
jgi:hypothetical protein